MFFSHFLFVITCIHIEGMFNIRCNAIAFGRIQTRLTAEKKGGAQLVLPTGDKVNLGIPGASQANFDAIPLRRAGTPEGVCVCVCVRSEGFVVSFNFFFSPHITEAAGSILLLSSPWASYISGQTLEVTGGALV